MPGDPSLGSTFGALRHSVNSNSVAAALVVDFAGTFVGVADVVALEFHTLSRRRLVTQKNSMAWERQQEWILE